MGFLFHGGITGTGSYVPEKVITNKDLEKIIYNTNKRIIKLNIIR